MAMEGFIGPVAKGSEEAEYNEFLKR